MRKYFEVFWTAFKLGCTSFGGPSAHLSYFYDTYVQRKQWLNDKAYANIVALSQFLPGPASSQVGIAIGLAKAGLFGGILSFLGFTLPSAVILLLFSLFFVQGDYGLSLLHSLKLVAVAIVIHAVIGMGKSFVTESKEKIVTLLALAGVLLIDNAWSHIIVIASSGILSYMLFRDSAITREGERFKLALSKRLGAACLIIYIGLLALLPIMSQLTKWQWLDWFERFYRAGALVFGGGHVVLPLLEREFVATGIMTEASFFAGYGLTQAVPGPLFTFATYIGADIGGLFGAVLATVAIFLPAFLLIIGALPFWLQFSQNPKLGAIVKGMNAAVVGILLATLFDPLWVTTVLTTKDFIVVSILFSLLMFWKKPSWLVVLLGIVMGFVSTL
ncbi:chromate efflux transporter [Metasolibacillus fluoroglycofenilyticus]|uniref:chromate efflux transporter n=1 Tax=Metasolibacillus fluoroglycofenilyticus TaxID=1239396 RepID=UPI000D33D4F8|nr:chromate efflux transporter [Metasolibacillus fluoroglycofenilyticus]